MGHSVYSIITLCWMTQGNLRQFVQTLPGWRLVLVLVECAANIQTDLTPANVIQFSGQNLLGTDENFCPLGTRDSWQLELVLYPYVFRAEVH